MLSSLASLLDSFRIPNRRRSGFSIFSRRRRRQISSLRCQGIPGVSLQETLAHEPLEQRRLLAVDVTLDSGLLTVNFDDASHDVVDLQINATGYSYNAIINGTENTSGSGLGTVTGLSVTDDGASNLSEFTLSDASTSLSEGLSISSEIDIASITSDVTTASSNGSVVIDSPVLFLSGHVHSGDASQTYGSVVLAADVNVTTSTGVPGDLQIHFQGTVDSDDNATPRTLNVKSEAIYFDADVGSQSALNDLVGYTVNDSAKRGQFYQSVHTTGNQTYQAGTSSGDVEFNGTYKADGNIQLLGEGTFGVVLSLAGDTSIDVGTGEFSVQKGSSPTYPGGNIVSEGESANLTITAGNITVPAGIGVASANSSLPSPELNEFTINGTGQVGLNTPQVLTSGDFYAEPQIRIYQDTTLLSGAGEINLSSGVNNGSKALTLGDGNQTGKIFLGGLQVRHLEVGAGNFDIELNGSMHLVTNMTDPTEFKNTGDLTLHGQGSSFFGGVEALNVANTFVAGCVATFGKDINLNNVTMIADSPHANRFDTRWTQTNGQTADGANISINNFKSDTSKAVEFDIGNNTPDHVNLTGDISSTNKLYFKGIGSVNVLDDATLAGGVYAQNLAHETDTTPALNFTGNVTLTGPMEFEGTSATFANGVEGGDNDLTLNFSQTATVDGYSNVANFTSEGAVNLSGNFTTTGFQKYEGNVALGGNTELVATTVEFTDGVTGNLKNLTLSPSDSFIKLDGIQLSGVENLTIDGDLNLSGNLSAGDISIQGNTTLIGDANLTSESVSCLSSLQINLGGTVDGAHALTVNGTTDCNGEIGGTTPLASLTTEGGDTSLGGNVTTTGNQKFGSDVTLTGDTKFVSGNLFDLSGLVGGGYNVEIDAVNAIIDAQKHSVSGIADLTVPGDVGLNGSIATTGNQLFSGDVGVLGNTTLTAGSGAISLGTGGEVIGVIHTLTLGDVNQTGDVTLGGASEVTLGGLNIGAGAFNLSVEAGDNGAVTINSPVEVLNNGTLTLTSNVSDSSSVIAFTGGLNATEPSSIGLAAIVGTDNSSINLGNVTYTGPASGDNTFAVLTTGDFLLGENFTGGDITIESLDTSDGLLIYHGGDTGSLTVQNNATVSGMGIKGWGDLNVNGDATVGSADANFSVSVDGDQNYAENVTLTGDAGFDGTAAKFTNGVLGGGHDLTLNFTQPSKLDGLANVKNFTSIHQIELNGSFETSGSQEFAGGVSLGGDATLHAASGFIKLDGIAGETYDLTIGNTTLPAPTANLIITSDVALNSLNATTGNYDASLTGASMKLQQATFDNSGNITLGDEATDSLVIGQGLVVQDAAVTTVAGTIASNGSEIAIRNINLAADTHIDTTNSGMVAGGAQILLDGNMQLNGFALDTKSGAVDTTLEGDITIANGSFKVLQGDLDLGESGNASNAANITVSETATIEVPENGTLNVFDGSKLDAGDNPITIIANNISFQSNAGNFTSTKEITITPATITNNISVGDAAGDGLNISQTTFSKMQAPNITLGGTGYEGTITVENLTVTSDRLNLITTGTGGAINISGDLDLEGKDASGISLYIEGSGATTDLSGDTSAEGDIIIDDAVRLLGESKLYSADGNITITGGTAGIYSTSGSNNDLYLIAENGTLIAGNQTGFGDNSGSDSFIGNLELRSGNATIGDGDQAISGMLDTSANTLTIVGTGSTNLSADSYSMNDVQGNSNSLTVTATTTGYGGYVGSISDVLELTFNGNGSDASFDLRDNVTTAGFQNWNVPVLNLRDNEGTSSDDLILTAGGDVTISELNRRMGSKKAGSILSNLNLTIDALSGNVAIDGVSISEPSGGRTDVGLGNVTISNAANVSLGGGFSDNGTGNGIDGNFIMTGISDTVTLNATSGSSYLIGGELSINSAHVVVDENVTLETAGNLSMNATGTVGGTAPGVLINAVADGTTSLKALGSSNITLTGTSGDQYAANGSTDGIRIGSTIGGNVSIETDSGNIELNGTAAGEGDEGIALHATTVETTGGGSITLIGKAGSGNTTIDPTAGDDNDGISFEAGTNNGTVYSTVIRTAGLGAGSISITGEATNRGEGIDLDDSTGATIIATDFGNVFLNGTNTGRDDGVQVGENTGFTVGGNLTIDGTGGGNGTLDGSGAGIKFEDSTANVTGTISFTGNSVDGYGTRLVSSQLRSITAGMTFTGSLTGNAVDGTTSRAAFLSEGSSLTASTDINFSYDLNHPSATAIKFDTEDGTASTVNSSIGNITLNGTANGMDHAVYIGDDTGLEAYENLTIAGVYQGAPGQGAGYYYGVAVFDDVTLTAQNQALAISGSTTQESGGGYGVGFDDNNTLAGNTSVTIEADSQDWSYGDNLSVQGNSSLEIIPESADFSEDIDLGNVTFGTLFTSAKIGVSTATGRSVQIGTQGLSVNGPIEIYGGTPTIDGEIASTAEGHSVLISGASGIEVGKNISTTNGALTLQGTTTVTDSVVLSSGSGVLDLTGKIVGEPAGQHKVTINTTGTATIVGAENLSEFVFNGGTIGLQGNVTTTDSQTYDGTVQLDGDTILQGFGLDIDGVVGNGNNFGLDFQEVEVLDGNFNGINDFTSGGDVQINGNFDTQGRQTYNANVSLSGDTEIAGTTLSLASGIDGAGHDLVLGFQEQTTIDGNFINIKDLKSSYSVALEGAITTSGYQEYNASAVLVGNTTLQGTDLTFSNGLDGNDNNLDLNFSNATFLNDNFANIRDLTSEGNVSLSGDITTSGSQNYKAGANLTENITLEGTALTLANGVDGNSKNLDLKFSQTTSLDGSFININNLISEGDVSLNGNLTTLGNQTYNAAVSLAGYTILQGESLLFSNGVDGASHSLGLDFSKATALNGTFENIDFLTSGGDVSLNGTIRTNESQTYNANVSLSGNTTLEGSVLSVASGVDGGGKNLDLNFSSTTSISGGFSKIVNLASEGDVAVEGTIQTFGSQTYNASVNLSGNTNLQGTSGTFAGAVNGDGKDLTLNFSAPTTIDSSSIFSGLVNLTVTGPSDLGASIETSGVQTYEGPVTLIGAVALDGQAGVFKAGVQGGGNDLVLDFNETVVIDGNGVFDNLGNLSVGGNASLNGSIQTNGFQHYAGSTTLLGNTFIGTGLSGDVEFGAVDGSHDLSIEAGSGEIDFFAALGGATPLQSLNLASASAVVAMDTLAIDGTGGTGPGLRLGPAVGNVNMTTAGSTISNAAQEGVLFAGGSAGTTLSGFTISNSGASGVVALAGNYSGTTFANSTVTGSAGSGFAANNADGFTVSDSDFSTNTNHGIRFDAAKNSVAQNNTVGNNGLYGVLVVTSDDVENTSNITVDNNFIGTDANEGISPNGRSGIWILGNAPGHGTVDTVSITGNTIANNAVHGIEVWGATNVHIGGRRGDPSENTITNNAQYGIAFTDTVTGSKVTGNTLVGNAQAGLFLNNAQGMQVGGGVDGASSLDISESDFGVVAGGDLSNTHVIGNTIHENVRAGFQLLNAKNFQLFRNTIEENGAYGVLALGESDGSRVYGNTISRHGAGVWLAGASGMTIGSLSGGSSTNDPLIGNRIEENSSVGIVIQGEDSFNNVILSNQIDTNIYFGIQFVQGATTVAVPRLTSVTTSQVTGVIRGDEGDVYRIQFFYTPLAQAEDGRHAQGEYLLGYEDVTIGSDGAATVELDVSSSQLVAGDIVTATATSMIDGSPTQSSSFSQGRRVREAPGNTP